MATRIPAYKQAQTEIKRYITAQGLGAGDPLPPEGVLAERLGISRPSLREGMKALESLGIVETRHGEGVFVAAFSIAAVLDQLPYTLLADHRGALELWQLRATLEIGVVCQVADTVSAAALQRLRGLAEAMGEAAARGESFEAQGREFHACLFGVPGNPLLAQVIGVIWEAFDRLNAAQGFNPGEWTLPENARGHLRMVEHLESGDKLALLADYQRYFDALGERIRAHLPPPAADDPTRGRSPRHP